MIGQWCPKRQCFPANHYLFLFSPRRIKVGSEKWSFDAEAASWDNDPGRVKLANDIAETIFDERILTPDMDILEFGCGTGLLTVRLSPHVHSVTGVDSSLGMIDVLRGKIERQKLANIRVRHLDIEKGEDIEGTYNLVVCSMTLHHVKEIKSLLDLFHKLTAHPGYVCIADLDPDEGQFHGNNDTVFHTGFDRAVLSQALQAAGFGDIRVRTAANIVKPIPDGGTRSFGVFLIIGQKKV
jgi:2-polyprenyl-3-methyl-5-hydroxy-6-metoxy-1,4-benzoquinol methylase